MKRKFKYDPEDLESLLLNKKFDELYPEEKAFVLRHMESAEEYASMRKTLLSIVDQPDSGPIVRPRSSTKRKLMREFDREKSAGWQIWLNSFFLPFSKRPAVSFGALAAIVVVAGAFFFYQMEDEKVMLAENKEKTEVTEPEKNEEKLQESEDESVPKTESDEQEAQNEMPPPKEVEIDPEQADVIAKDEVVQDEVEQEVAEPETHREVEVLEDSENLAEAEQFHFEDSQKAEDLEVPAEEKVEKSNSEVLAENEVSTTRQIQRDSFFTDDQMGNMNQPISVHSADLDIKEHAEPKATSMSKASFLLSNLHTSM